MTHVPYQGAADQHPFRSEIEQLHAGVRADEARELAASERISAAQAVYDEAMAGYDPTDPDHEVHAFNAMKAAIAKADAIARDMARADAAGGAGEGWRTALDGAVCAMHNETRRAGFHDGFNGYQKSQWDGAYEEAHAAGALARSLLSAPPPPAQPYGGPGIRDPLVEITRKPGKEPCGECRIQPGETCDICGAQRTPPPAQQGSSSPLREGTRDHIASVRLIPWEPGSLGGVHVTYESGFQVALPLSQGETAPKTASPWGNGVYDFASSVAAKVGALTWACADTADAMDDRYADVQRIVDAELRSLATARDDGTGADQPEMFVGGYLNDLCLAGKHPAQQQAPTPDPRKEALAVLEGIPRWATAEEFARALRDLGRPVEADRIEAALATLSATDQDGEVR
ncbi:hypothetical protein [Methylobacterium brachiatum]|uniref:hypothetical protein n=1 Tax=Methylobacterium brachiatum TaxID=269660 RepID=UPI0008EEC6CD|nr:hypothetical protein [Methylobacterium brachiatum]SFJ68354.1 hypothetical protein SAMN02799642_05164 [Methylobacterium brachiatum]